MPEDMNRNVGNSLNPAALTPEDAARLLTRVGGQAVTVEMLHADRKAGAPRNADGTINLVHYAAWLVKEMSGGD
jgi:hypothetical protein